MIHILSSQPTAEQRIEFESPINIRPRLGNCSILIQSEELRQKVEDVTLEILGGRHDK